MITRAAVLLLLLSLSATLAIAGEIREFCIPTLERLGNDLIRVSQRPDRGASDPIRKRAQQTAIAALHGRLFNLRYDYVVINDPDGKRFLIYALGKTGKLGEAVLAGHARVTVSADGGKAEQVDALSKTMMVDSDLTSGLPAGFKPTAMYFNQIVSNKPVETLIYTSHVAKKPIYVGTPDGKVWIVRNGRMRIDNTKPGNTSEAAAAHKALGH
jgi:hypothetical protein